MLAWICNYVHYKVWNYFSIPKVQRCFRLSLRIEKLLRSTLYWVCDYLFMLGLQLVHVSKHEQNICTLNRRHFDCIVVKEDICILVQISLKYQFTQFTDPHMHHITLSRNELTCPDDRLFHTTSPAGVSLRHLIYTAPYQAMIDMATANLKYCHPQRQTSVNARFPENLW